MNGSYLHLLILIIAVATCSCNDRETQTDGQESKTTPLFELLTSEQTGIDLKYGESIYGLMEGAGTAVGDFNQDGLQDIFIVGDSLHGLYLNKGGLEFENAFDNSGIHPEIGVGSVTVWDFNEDGKDDILLLSKTQNEAPLHTAVRQTTLMDNHYPTNILLFINQGEGRFKYASPEYGLMVNGNFSGASLSDFNEDGIIDLFVTEWFVDFEKNGDMLPHFISRSSRKTEVTLFLKKPAGSFTKYDFKQTPTTASTLKTSFSIFSGYLDGRKQAVVTSDFDKSDYLVHFDSNGPAFERIDMANTLAYYSMGIDVVDLNNDLMPDMIVADMRPERNSRQKFMRFEKPYTWEMLAKDGKTDLLQQQVKNSINLALGNGQCAEISQLIDADATDWSWSVLGADFDNNGFKDLFFSNGYYLQNELSFDAPLILDSLISNQVFESELAYRKSDTITGKHFRNYFFMNYGGLDFEKLEPDKVKWSKPLNSRGASYADLDNDGDLDFIVNNYHHEAVVYKNLSIENGSGNFLRVEIEAQPSLVLNTQFYLYRDTLKQHFEIQPVRGFYSTSEKTAHFGLGKDSSTVDSLWIAWPNGKYSKLENIQPNQVLTIIYDSLTKTADFPLFRERALFRQTKIAGLDFQHQENEFIDYTFDPLLPQLYSREGPCIEVADLNGDDMDDVIIGGAAGQPTTLFFQQADASFQRMELDSQNDKCEDVAVVAFDYDLDGDMDIYLASGGSEQKAGSKFYTDRLYENLGSGKFELNSTLPTIRSIGSCVAVGDLNNDGWPDLFVGSRVTPQDLSISPSSHLLINNHGSFRLANDEDYPDFKELGMVTDAMWIDFDHDGWDDLLVAGEYMPIRLFRNGHGKLEETTDEAFGRNMKKGNWLSLERGDFNGDGHIDFIAGNLGLNTRYKADENAPLEMFVNDFDDNGYKEVISTFYENGKQYTVKNLNTLKPRIDGLSKKFYSHRKFAQSDIYEIFAPEKLHSSKKLTVESTSSVIAINQGDGSFSISSLPRWAQVGPIQDIIVKDFDSDGLNDALIMGNFYHSEVERGRYTAMKGFLLKGDGQGGFKTLLPSETGFLVPGDGRAMHMITIKGKEYIITLENDSPIKVFHWLGPNTSPKQNG